MILVFLFLTMPPQAQTNNLPEIKLLDKWECGTENICAVGIDKDGNIFLLLGDKGGIKKIFHKGQVVWERPQEKRSDM
jgi:hypothetical protein